MPDKPPKVSPYLMRPIRSEVIAARQRLVVLSRKYIDRPNGAIERVHPYTTVRVVNPEIMTEPDRRLYEQALATIDQLAVHEAHELLGADE